MASLFGLFNRRMIIDFICIISVGVALLIVELFGSPFKSGFYCSDTSIKYPYYESTISTGVLAIVALLFPVLIMMICEGIYLFESSTPRDSWNSISLRLATLCYHFGGLFIYGAGLCQMSVTVAKYTVGRLRPHFVAVCQPSVNCNTHDPYDYVTDYVCTNRDNDKTLDARLSFPSGHASMAFYSATYTVLYLQKRMPWRVSVVVSHLIQALLLFGAWYTAMTRIQNNMHHWGDVLVGMLIGVFWAIFFVKYVVNLQLTASSESETSIHRSSRETSNNAAV
ncbi:putative phosphatidate phosphatase [Nilaparvata lugens]|uniref:putative phosphatidate phosphatase n=1 Tax=Nilaparvata lugens TaxID=108931 RepID=UPI00193DECA6|nr:putative phosphatidate phosphatase [Nilaparvata lugens]